MYKIKIQHEEFSLEEELKTIQSSKVGAVVSFIGMVRDFNDTSKLTSLFLDCYIPMAYKEIETIVKNAIDKYNLEYVTVIHKIGKIKTNEQIVLVLVAGKHRKESFLACEDIINYLKIKAPFFKSEQDTNNNSTWVKID